MKLFELDRYEDVSGKSGTGIVAQGVEFDDGTVVMRWLTQRPSTAFYASIDDVRYFHGHDGKTRLVYVALDGREIPHE